MFKSNVSSNLKLDVLLISSPLPLNTFIYIRMSICHHKKDVNVSTLCYGVSRGVKHLCNCTVTRIDRGFRSLGARLLGNHCVITLLFRLKKIIKRN